MKSVINNIICTTDFSDYSKQAVFYGASLAKKADAKLHVCHVIDFKNLGVYGQAMYNEIEKQQNAMLFEARHEMEQLIRESGMNFEPVIKIGAIDEEINKAVEETSADLVITTTHGRSGIKRAILGSVAERLMRSLKKPFLAIQSASAESNIKGGEDIRLNKILVGSDFSKDSDIAVEYGARLALDFNAELHLVYVMPTSVLNSLWEESTAKDKDMFQKQLAEQYAEKLKAQLPKENQEGLTLKTELLTGKAYLKLQEYAKSFGIDMIVMGVRGIGLVESIMVGSTTDRTIRQAPCPVMAVCHAQ
jgi:nucleotide-binding universal stress UspA family protein